MWMNNFNDLKSFRAYISRLATNSSFFNSPNSGHFEVLTALFLKFWIELTFVEIISLSFSEIMDQLQQFTVTKRTLRTKQVQGT